MKNFHLICAFSLLCCVSVVFGVRLTIKNPNDFESFKNNVLQGHVVNVILETDLDFSGASFSLSGPIGVDGNKCVPFTGALDGRGHKITNLDMQTTANSSLFCSLKDVEIKNLIFDDSCSFTGKFVSALSREATGKIILENIITNAHLKGTEAVAGLIVDGNDVESHLEIGHCIINGSLSGNQDIAGAIGSIVGVKSSTFIHIHHSQVASLISSSSYSNNVAGFVAILVGGTDVQLRLEHNIVEPQFVIKSTSSNGGCMFGFISGGSGMLMDVNNNIINCPLNRTVTSSYVSEIKWGGIAGYIFRESSIVINIADNVINGYWNFLNESSTSGGLFGQIIDCSNLKMFVNHNENNACMISEKEKSYIGGFVGYFSVSQGCEVTVNQSRNNGNISTKGDFVYSGGFVGFIIGDKHSPDHTVFKFINCENNGDVIGNGTLLSQFSGFFSTSEELTSMKWSIENSLNRGTIVGGNAFGFSPIVTYAKNVVDLGDVHDDSIFRQSDFCSFWNDEIDGNVVSLYSLNDTFVNCSCPLPVTLFFKSEDPEDVYYFYENDNGTSVLVDDDLNTIVEESDYGVKWTRDLKLSIEPFVTPSSSSVAPGWSSISQWASSYSSSSSSIFNGYCLAMMMIIAFFCSFLNMD